MNGAYDHLKQILSLLPPEYLFGETHEHQQTRRLISRVLRLDTYLDNQFAPEGRDQEYQE